MKSFVVYILLSVCVLSSAFSQTLAEAKGFYLQGEYAKALPVYEAEYNAKQSDPLTNLRYGVCLLETGKNEQKAEECLLFASQKKQAEAFLYLGKLYTQKYRFSEASNAFDRYESSLKKKDEKALTLLEEKRKRLSRLQRFVSSTEDIQIIDSLVVKKTEFLSAYKLSRSSGRLDYFNSVFSANRTVESTVYYNEMGTKIYFGQPDKENEYSLFSMEKLLEDYGNEKQMSANNFGIEGSINYPYMMADGVTIYFAAKDNEGFGGYDLFVSRYNMNNDTYLSPERLNMPFNSEFNDYLLVVDEQKGVGWFASDRFQNNDDVCVYTFIPNKSVKIVETDDERYLVDRARIYSIKSSWIKDKDYSQLIATARKTPEEKTETLRDFVFVINDTSTYYKFTDFKNTTARELYLKVVQLKAEQNTLSDKLQAERDAYASASPEKKRTLSANILSMERKIESLTKEIHSREIQARNQEVSTLHK